MPPTLFISNVDKIYHTRSKLLADYVKYFQTLFMCRNLVVATRTEEWNHTTWASYKSFLQVDEKLTLQQLFGKQCAVCLSAMLKSCFKNVYRIGFVMGVKKRSMRII